MIVKHCFALKDLGCFSSVKMPPNPDMESVGEVTQLLQEWETISRDTPLNVERLIGILTKMADVVERETDNFYKQVRIDLCTCFPLVFI